MKTLKSLFLIFVLCVVSCQRGAQPETSATDSSVKLEQALATGRLGVIQSASQVTVTVFKDAHIPVKGTLNFTDGFLNLKQPDAWMTANLDLSTWYSNLVLRDQRVMSIVFATDAEHKELIGFVADPVKQEFLDQVVTRTQQAAVTVQGKLTLLGVTQPVTLVLQSVRQGERLIVDTVEPVMLKLSAFGLGERLEKLKIICGHQAIEDDLSIQLHLELGGL